jgi:hypothetical protein
MSARERAAKLLGSGVEPEVVATALGVTPGYISQLLAEEDFAKEVTELRFVNLQNASERDGKYDRLEDRVLDKLDQMLDYMTKPRELLGAAHILNTAKRRGIRPENAATPKQDSVQLHFPTVIQQNFIVNHVNQVVAVGEEGQDGQEGSIRDLTTISAKQLLEQVRRIPAREAVLIEGDNRGNVGSAARERVTEGSRS